MRKAKHISLIFVFVLPLYTQAQIVSPSLPESGWPSVAAADAELGLNNNAAFDQVLNPLDCDNQLLNAALFYALNARRQRMGKPALEPAPEMVNALAYYKHASSPTRFRPIFRNQQRLERWIYPAGKHIGFKPRLLRCGLFEGYAVDYRNGKFYYDRDDEETALKLYKGNRPSPKDTNIQRKPIPTLTYRQFADRLVRQLFSSRLGRELRSDAFTYMALYVELEARSVEKANKIPKAQIACLLAGYRIPWNKELIEGPRGIAHEPNTLVK